MIKEHYEDPASRKADLETIILSLAESYLEEINLILSVPSFKNIYSAIAVVSEIGVKMDVFPTATHLCSWAGPHTYNAELYKKSDVLPLDREITVEQAILIAKAQGYRIVADVS